MDYYIYALTDPRKDGAVFYIGKASLQKNNVIQYRLHDHIHEMDEGKKTHKCNVIRKILIEELEIGFEVLSWHETEQEAFDEETRLIDEIGLENLTNVTPGGEGVLGYKHSDEIRKHLSKTATGRTMSEETKAKISLTMKRLRIKPPSPRGKYHSKESKQKMSEAQLQRWSKCSKAVRRANMQKANKAKKKEAA